MKRVAHDGDALRIDSATDTLYYPRTSRPYIQPNHIDGPVLHLRDGSLHWLTPWERFLFWLGKTDAEALEHKWWDRPWPCL